MLKTEAVEQTLPRAMVHATKFFETGRHTQHYITLVRGGGRLGTS